MVKTADTRRQLIEDARAAALSGRWDDAVSINQRLIERTAADAEAHNRLGRAFIALGRYAEATDAYSGALRADPANLIARRNLQRLEKLRQRPAPSRTAMNELVGLGAAPRTTVFIEEVGKTWVDELVNPAGLDVLVEIYSAEQLELVVEDGRLIVQTRDGRRLGEIEAKTADRVIQLMEGGNRYEVYSLGLSSQSFRVILREVHRDPSQTEKVSFPRQITTRAYLRERDLLRQRDEADFFFSDDDEEDDEATATESDDEDPTETDTEPFIDDQVSGVEEEEQSI